MRSEVTIDLTGEALYIVCRVIRGGRCISASRLTGCVMIRLASALLMIVLGASAARADTMLVAMNGVWRGEGQYILLDTERMLANTDPEKPFQRDPLSIRNISGRMVVFEIGSERFIGLFQGEQLSLGGVGVSAAVELRRDPPAAIARQPKGRQREELSPVPAP